MYRIFAIWENWKDLNVVDSLVVSIIAIVIVFFVLALLIFITWSFQKSMDYLNSKIHICPREENKILDEDEDAVAAMIAATIDFHKETGKDANIVSVKKVED